MSGLTDLPANMRQRVEAVASGCWEWRGAVVRNYGQVRVGGGKRGYTHRVAYEALVGPIPDGLQIDHLCRNTICCNPAHLEPVTAKVNSGRRPGVLLPHCPQGHELSGPNLKEVPQHHYPHLTHRQCRTCTRAYQAEYRARKRAEQAAA